MLIRQRGKREEKQENKDRETEGCLLSLVTLFAALNMLKMVSIKEKRKKSPFKFNFSTQWLDIVGFLLPASAFSIFIFFPSGQYFKMQLGIS